MLDAWCALNTTETLQRSVSSTFFACTSLSCLLRALYSYFLEYSCLGLGSWGKNLVFFTTRRYCARVHRQSWPSSHVLDHTDCFQSFQKHAYLKNSYTGLYFVMLCVEASLEMTNQLSRSQLSLILAWCCYTWAASYECMLHVLEAVALYSLWQLVATRSVIYIHVSFT